MLDVAIVGAGPTGSRAAYRLALQGYSVAVLEKRPAAGLKTCCTGIISQECISRFNIPVEVILQQVRSASLFSPSGNSIRIMRPEVQACVVNRSAFDHHLAATAQNQGVNYLFNTAVESLEIKVDRVVLSCRSTGAVFTLDAKFVILACGFNTPLVRKSGFGLSRYFTTGVQAEVQTKELKEVEIYFGNCIAPGFFAWLVPTQNGRALAGLMSHQSAGFHLRNWLQELAEKGKIEPAGHNILCSGIPMYPLSRTFQDRVLVLGDAAGQVKPTTGGGIYFGMLCADIAADTLHKAQTTRALKAKTLLSYEREWRRLLQAELRNEYLARRAYQFINDHQIDSLFVELKESQVVESILNGENVSFDNHGGLLLKTLRRVLTSRVKRIFQ